MTATEGEVTLATLAGRLDSLTDLFRRRLLDDRVKQATIEQLQARLDRAERAQSAESLRPLVTQLALVIDRLQSAPPSEELVASIVEELQFVLELLGVTPIGSSDDVDPRRHEIVSVTGEGPKLRVGELLRTGYEKDGVVLRPARITAIRVDPTRAGDPAEWGEEA